MSILLFPTDFDEIENLDRINFSAWVKTKDNDFERWTRLIYTTDAADWYPEIQEDFEKVCELYWAESGQEAGFFPGGSIKEAFAAKLSAKKNKPKFFSERDIRDAKSAKAAFELAKRALDMQASKVTMCKVQLEQSENKLTQLTDRYGAAEKRWLSMKDISGNDVEDF